VSENKVEKKIPPEEGKVSSRYYETRTEFDGSSVIYFSVYTILFSVVHQGDMFQLFKAILRPSLSNELLCSTV
jgi:hypothetical protein